MSDIDAQLREAAREDSTAFDAELHARVMAAVARGAAAETPERRRIGWPVAIGTLAAAAVAVGIFVARPVAPARPMPAIASRADRSIGQAYDALAVIEAPPSDLGLGGVGNGVSRFLADQVGLAASFRPAGSVRPADPFRPAARPAPASPGA